MQPTRAMQGIGGVFIALVVAFMGPPAAEAHGGLIAIRTTSGPYRIEAMVSRRQGMIDEAVRVLDAASRQPLPVKVVVLALRDENGAVRGPFVARPLGSIYEARYPPPEGGSGWLVTIAVDGPPGVVEVEHQYQAPAPEWAIGSGWTGLLMNVAFLLLLIAMPIAGHRWGRRPRSSPATSPGGDIPGPSDQL